MATKLDVKWSHDHQTWVATDPTTPGLCGTHPNKTKARQLLRQAQADREREADERATYCPATDAYP